jgi:hypothetical protein
MEKLPKDLIVYLAMELELPEILLFSMASKKTNERVCKNNDFWRNKIEKERPGLLQILNSRSNKLQNKFREIYFEVYKSKFSNEFTIIDDKYIVKGDYTSSFELGGFKSSYFGYIYKNILYETGDIVWLVTSNCSDYYPSLMTGRKNEAVEKVIQSIENYFIIDNEEKMEIKRTIEESDDYTFKDYSNFILFNMKKLIIK